MQHWKAVKMTQNSLIKVTGSTSLVFPWQAANQELLSYCVNLAPVEDETCDAFYQTVFELIS